MNNDPRLRTHVNLTVPFHDVDMMGVVWHGNYFRYLEIAREQLLRQFNYGYQQMRDSGYAWPVVDSRIKYRHPLTFEQAFTVQAQLEEYEHRLKIQYNIF
jgi:Predicted thioesterase